MAKILCTCGTQCSPCSINGNKRENCPVCQAPLDHSKLEDVVPASSHDGTSQRSESQSHQTIRRISFLRVLLADFVFGLFIYPFGFCLFGTILMSFGFSFGRRRSEQIGPEYLPLIASMAAGFFVAIVVGSILRFLWFRSIAKRGIEIHGTVNNVPMNGLNFLEYKYSVDGKEYYHRHWAIPFSIPKIIPSEGETIFIVHEQKPKRAYMRDLFEFRQS